MKKQMVLDQVRGQGEAHKPTREMLRLVRSGLDSVRSESSRDLFSRMQWAERVRFCLWEGQSPDGRKRGESLGRKAFPFDGASDARVRLADFVLRVSVATLKQSVKRSSVRIKGMEANDVDVAGHLQTLCNWLLNNRMAGAWRMHLERLANWGLGDSPAVSLLHVYQEVTDCVKLEEMDVESVTAYVAELLGVEDVEDPMFQVDVAGMLLDKDREEELVALLSNKYPELKRAVLARGVRRLREDGVADFPVVYRSVNEPRIEALRMWRDVFVPVLTRDPGRCRVVYVRKWMTLADLEEKERIEGWDSGAIDRLTDRRNPSAEELGGAAGLSYVSEVVDVGAGEWGALEDLSARKDEFEVFFCYIRGVNEDGVSGVWVLPVSLMASDEENGVLALGDVELLDYPHGDLPFVWFVREYVTENVLDSRGVCELLQTDQDFLKSMRDMSADHAQLFTLPPYEHDMLNAEGQVRFSPLALVRVGRQNKLRPIEIPQGSELPLRHMAVVEKMVSEYFGVGMAEVNEAIQGVLTQDMVDDFLGVVKEAMLMCLQLAVTYMDADELRVIVNDPNLDVEFLRQGMRKLQDIEVDVDVSAMQDLEYVQGIAKVIQETLLTIDTEQTVKRSELVDWLCRQISPSLANKVLRPVEEASEQEVRDEELNFTMIKAGIEPPMKEEGQNFGLRLQTLERIMQENPAAVQEMSPISLEILQARYSHLQNQVQQQENAVIGRQMGRQVLGPGGSGAGAAEGAGAGAPEGGGY